MILQLNGYTTHTDGSESERGAYGKLRFDYTKDLEERCINE